MKILNLELKSLILVAASLLISLLFPSNVLASETFAGTILKTHDTYYIVDNKTKQTNALLFANEISKQQISRLDTGDFASVAADRIKGNTSNRIVVSSVDYVGLALLSGIWNSNVNLCYEFTGFTSLYVYSTDKEGKCTGRKSAVGMNSKTIKYTYFINPDIDGWNLLISSLSSEYVGELVITSPKRIEIKLFDSQTVAILGVLVLRR